MFLFDQWSSRTWSDAHREGSKASIFQAIAGFVGMDLPATDRLWAEAHHFACDNLYRTATTSNKNMKSSYEPRLICPCLRLVLKKHGVGETSPTSAAAVCRWWTDVSGCSSGRDWGSLTRRVSLRATQTTLSKGTGKLLKNIKHMLGTKDLSLTFQREPDFDLTVYTD